MRLERISSVLVEMSGQEFWSRMCREKSGKGLIWGIRPDGTALTYKRMFVPGTRSDVVCVCEISALLNADVNANDQGWVSIRYRGDYSFDRWQPDAWHPSVFRPRRPWVQWFEKEVPEYEPTEAH